MNNAQVLASLIDHVNASDKPATIGWDEVTQWQDKSVKRFVKLGLLVKDVNTQSLECVACEHRCTMDVVLTEDAKRAFIVCDHSDMQDHMGRITVPLERLQQWQTSAKEFAGYVSVTLGLDAKPSYSKETASFKLGMLKSKVGRRSVTLLEKPLRLEIAGHAVPLEDMLFFDGDTLALDADRVRSILNLNPANNGKAHIPNIKKQDIRKMATQIMYQNWRDEYQALLLKTPNKPDSWYATQIAKLSMAQGKSAETIRKNMKN